MTDEKSNGNLNERPNENPIETPANNGSQLNSETKKEKNPNSNLTIAFAIMFIMFLIAIWAFVLKDADLITANNTGNGWFNAYVGLNNSYKSSIANCANESSVIKQANQMLNNFVYKNVNGLCSQYEGAILDQSNITIDGVTRNATIVLNCTMKQVYINIAPLALPNTTGNISSGIPAANITTINNKSV